MFCINLKLSILDSLFPFRKWSKQWLQPLYLSVIFMLLFYVWPLSMFKMCILYPQTFSLGQEHIGSRCVPICPLQSFWEQIKCLEKNQRVKVWFLSNMAKSLVSITEYPPWSTNSKFSWRWNFYFIFHHVVFKLNASCVTTAEHIVWAKRILLTKVKYFLEGVGGYDDFNRRFWFENMMFPLGFIIQPLCFTFLLPSEIYSLSLVCNIPRALRMTYININIYI